MSISTAVLQLYVENYFVSPTAPMDFIAFTRDLDFGGTSVLQCFPIGVTSKYKREVLLSCAEH